MPEILISVVMPVYNGSRWIREAIESVLAQSFPQFEYIIVDDGSTDDSHEIMQQYASVDSRIVVLRKRNTGLADTLNWAIDSARGQWIARIDADDVCEVDRLDRQYRYALAHPQCVLIGTSLRQIDEKGQCRRLFSNPEYHEPLVKRMTRYGKSFAHSSVIFRRDAFLFVGKYRQRIRRAEDLDLWLRLSEYGHIACVNLPLIQCRVHDSQISHQEGGVRQQIDRTVVLVSHWLRMRGYQDPVGGSSAEFEEFYEWISGRATSTPWYLAWQYLKSVEQLRTENAALRSRLRRIGEVMVNYRGLSMLLLTRTFGDHSAPRLGQLWVERRAEKDLRMKARG